MKPFHKSDIFGNLEILRMQIPPSPMQLLRKSTEIHRSVIFERLVRQKAEDSCDGKIHSRN